MNEVDKRIDTHISEARQHLDKARELKSEGPATQIRALEKAKESVDQAIDALSTQPTGHGVFETGENPVLTQYSGRRRYIS